MMPLPEAQRTTSENVRLLGTSVNKPFSDALCFLGSLRVHEAAVEIPVAAHTAHYLRYLDDLPAQIESVVRPYRPLGLLKSEQPAPPSFPRTRAAIRPKKKARCRERRKSLSTCSSRLMYPILRLAPISSGRGVAPPVPG